MKTSFENIHFYVNSVKGSDRNDGQSESFALWSLAAASERIRTLLTTDGDPVDLTLHLASGVHFTDETLIFDGTGARREYRLHICGEGATVTSCRSIPLSDFTADGDGVLTHAIPKVYDDRLFRAFYADGRPASLASTEEVTMRRSVTYFKESGARRFPDAAYENKTGNTYFVAYVDRSLIDGYFPADQVAKGEVDLSGTELWIRIEWYYMGFRVLGIDYDHSLGVYETPDSRATTLSEKDYNDYYALVLNYEEAVSFTYFKDGVMRPLHDIVRGKDHGCLKNNRHFLTERGEYCYDHAKRTVSYLPREGDTAAGLATLEQLFCFRNMKNVTLSELTFTGTSNASPQRQGHIYNQAGRNRSTNLFDTAAAVLGEDLSDFTIKRCTFRDLYAGGIILTGGNRGIAITDNVFERVGSSGILIGTTAPWDAATNSLTDAKIENNYMHDMVTVFYEHCAITVTRAKNLSILHNTVINCPYTAISVGWGWSQCPSEQQDFINLKNVEVAYNYVENYMCLLYDGGAIYTLNGNAPIERREPFNSLHDNYAYCGSYEGRRTCDDTPTCWYHDGGSSHWHTYRNVVFVDPESLSRWSYVSLQGADGWGDTASQQVYNILLEDNCFINLVQPYLTTGYGRVKRTKNLVERGSRLIVKEDLHAIAEGLRSAFEKEEKTRHGDRVQAYMLIDPERFTPIEPTTVSAVNGVITHAGCDTHRGRALALSDFYTTIAENPDEKPNETMRGCHI